MTTTMARIAAEEAAMDTERKFAPQVGGLDTPGERAAREFREAERRIARSKAEAERAAADTAMPQARNAHLVVLKVMPGEPCKITVPGFDARCVSAKITRGGQLTYDVEYWLDGELTRVTLFDDELEIAR